jgi:hypothetical protein
VAWQSEQVEHPEHVVEVLLKALDCHRDCSCHGVHHQTPVRLNLSASVVVCSVKTLLQLSPERVVIWSLALLRKPQIPIVKPVLPDKLRTPLQDGLD